MRSLCTFVFVFVLYYVHDAESYRVSRQPAGIPGAPGDPGGVEPGSSGSLWTRPGVGPVSPGGGKQISPGGSSGRPGGSDIGESEEEDRNSPQQRPDFPGSIEGGVIESITGTIKGCNPKAGNSDVGGIQTGNSNQMCLELLCAYQCPNGHKVVNGCPTCQCQETFGRFISKCPDPPISALLPLPSGSIGVVVAEALYTLGDNGKIDKADVTLERHLQNGGLCGSTVDAAFTSPLHLEIGSDAFSVYFSGTQYSLYKKNGFAFVSGPHDFKSKLEGGSPTPLQLSFPWWVTKIDAAMKWNKDGIIYFFFKYHGTGYFSKYDPVSKRMGVNYPRRTVDSWKGLPLAGPDAAVSSSRGTYFAVGRDIYQVDESGDVQYGYPRPIKGNFIRCTRN